ncbi:MAG: hypothetical protein H0T79_10495, partial [Deltaproteobacteria bacterium]|nr:hypothetical protein [Deltaproteobacteria bacterium]
MSERRQRLWTVAIALGVALVVVLGTRTARLPDRWYADHSHYRAQVDAFLSGRLAVATVPEGLRHDLAWTDAGVQQVWGLGVPAWQTPFEAIGRVIGVSPFPDRVALLGFLALLFYAVIRAWRDGETRWGRLGVFVIAGLLPAFVTLLRGRLGVYEEAAAYAYGTAILLACGTVALHRVPTRRGLWLLVFAAGFTGFVRPTVWFYGFATLVVASGIWFAHAGTWRRALPAIALAGGLFVVGGGALYATNAMRFGAGGEFGHRLNVEDGIPGNIVATRFSYPFQRVGLGEATTELVSAMFDRPEQRSRGGHGFYQPNLFGGQSSVVRWREFYFTAYTWAYVPILVAALIFGVIAWLRRRRSTDLGASRTRILAVWAVLGMAPIFAFYLRSPSISSRYLLDFAPAVAILLILSWRRLLGALPARSSSLAFAVLIALWATAVVRARRHRPRVGSEPVDRVTAALSTYPRSRPITYARTLPTAYDLADPLLAEHLELPTYDRCYASTGDELDCAVPAVAGDRHLHGERVDLLDETAEHPWRFTLREVPAAEL